MTDFKHENLSQADLDILAGEIRLHEKVRESVRKEALAEAPDMSSVHKHLIELRDEAIHASERDLPSLFQQLYTHHSLAARNFDKKLPDMRAPYFARMQLTENGKSRNVLIGYQTFIDQDAGVVIIDWRHAALARVFFNYRQGDEFEIELPGRLSTGTVTVRHVITFEKGEVTGVSGPGFALIRSRDQVWRRSQHTDTARLAGGQGKAVNVRQFGLGITNQRLPDVSALLDRDQFEILSREDETVLLILGGAGSGKTTVAVHRMAMLAFRRPGFYLQKAMRVVVPEQGLVRLTSRLLAGLNLPDVKVQTYDAWVTEQGRHILRGLPKKIHDWTPSQVVFAKRHPAMLAAVEAYVGNLQAQCAERMKDLFDWAPDCSGRFAADQDGPLWERLERAETYLKANLPPGQSGSGSNWHRDMVNRYFAEARKQINDIGAARSELFTNSRYLEVLCAASGGRVTPRMAEELARHTRKQFEDAYGGTGDAGLLRSMKTVDGSEVEEDDVAQSVDVEDFSVLLYFLYRVHGKVERKDKGLNLLRHLVIDEAQDLAPVEHCLLGRTMFADGSVTVAGDAAQQSDPEVIFSGWDDVLAHIDLGAADEARLTTNYRCPRPVAEFAHNVLGHLAPAQLPNSIRDGEEVLFSSFPNEGLAIVAMTDALNQLQDQEPHASVAIICANEENARTVYEGLKNTGDVRLVVDGEFEFRPGVDVTDVAQIKGLEFDYVIIPDADINTYPATDVARRTLHIAATRAVHQLWVISMGRPSELIAADS